MAASISFGIGGARTRWSIIQASAGGSFASGGALLTVSQSSQSTAYVQVNVRVLSPSGYDPTGDVVQFAFVADAYPMGTVSTWYAGSWATYPGPAYWAQCLVGPGSGGVALSQGTYQVWLKVTDSPEVPVLQQVFLNITP